MMVTMAEPPRARCPEPGCAWRWRGGPPRPCPAHQHAGDDDAARRKAYGRLLAAILKHDSDGEPMVDTDGDRSEGQAGG
jgi:hypothetical protein